MREIGPRTALDCTQAMLRCLNVDERIALVLDELGADDTLAARLCEITEVAHRKRLSRARHKLRPILEDLCGLATPAAPCRCARQARAKQLAGIPPSELAALPMNDKINDRVIDARELVRTRDGLRVLREIGPVFGKTLVDPPEDLWAELQRRLPTLLGTPAS